MRIAVGVSSCAFVLGCAAQIGIDDGKHDPGSGLLGQRITCSASLERFPVAGPSNVGWDPEWYAFSCAGERANTDYYVQSRPDLAHASGHLGNDIFGERGTPVVAASNGTIAYVANEAVGGLNVGIVDTCGWTTYYAHLDSIEPGLARGQTISAGDPIGAMGNTGSARGTAVHLHFSLYPDGRYAGGIDPFPHLRERAASACAAAEPMPDPEPEPAPADPSCGELAIALGYGQAACEWNGNGACGGVGPSTWDCEHCCNLDALEPASVSCGEWAARNGYFEAACEWNGNGACGGVGPSTWDCDHCCDVASL